MHANFIKNTSQKVQFSKQTILDKKENATRKAKPN
jgi:hypothetical protein